MAQSSCVITIPGVLMQIVSSAPIQTGIQLYHGLNETFNVLLVTDDDKEKTDYWLRMENLNKHGAIIYGEENPLETKGSIRLKQISALRNRGYAIDMVVEPDPEIAAELIRNGFTVCNFLHHAYAYPTWRPDYEGEKRGWEQIQKQVELDQLIRSKDRRLDPDNTELL